jgi:hypothetical protein
MRMKGREVLVHLHYVFVGIGSKGTLVPVQK